MCLPIEHPRTFARSPSGSADDQREIRSAFQGVLQTLCARDSGGDGGAGEPRLCGGTGRRGGPAGIERRWSAASGIGAAAPTTGAELVGPTILQRTDLYEISLSLQRAVGGGRLL